MLSKEYIEKSSWAVLLTKVRLWLYTFRNSLTETGSGSCPTGIVFTLCCSCWDVQDIILIEDNKAWAHCQTTANAKILWLLKEKNIAILSFQNGKLAMRFLYPWRFFFPHCCQSWSDSSHSYHSITLYNANKNPFPTAWFRMWEILHTSLPTPQMDLSKEHHPGQDGPTASEPALRHWAGSVAMKPNC